MKGILCKAVLLTVLFLCACEDEVDNTKQRYCVDNVPVGEINKQQALNLTASEKETIKIHNRFAVEYAKEFLEKNHDDNFVVSPLSAICNISMLANGSTGALRSQIVDAVDCPDLDALNNLNKRLINGLGRVDLKDTEFSLSNSIWLNDLVDARISNGFHEILKECYMAQIGNVQFDGSLALTINDWISNSTKGLIKDFYGYKDIDPSEVCILVNALYFKGAFRTFFKKGRTERAPFYDLEGNKVGYAYLMRNHMNVGYAENDKMRCISIPIGKQSLLEDSFELLIILPENNSSMSDALESASSANLKKRTMAVKVPKFKMEFDTDLSETMATMGIDISKARMSDIMAYGSPVEMAQLKMRQKTTISIDEKGVEGASATISETWGHGDHDDPSFIADRPFVYIVRECESKAVLFAGAYVKPVAAYQ